MKRPFSWNSGEVASILATAASGTVEPEALRFEGDEALFDEALEDLLFEAEAPQHRGVESPALIEPLVELPLALIGALKLAHGDGLVAHEGQGLSRASRALSLEGRNVEDDESGDHEPEKDVQPPSMPPHEAESHDVSVAGRQVRETRRSRRF